MDMMRPPIRLRASSILKSLSPFLIRWLAAERPAIPAPIISTLHVCCLPVVVGSGGSAELSSLLIVFPVAYAMGSIWSTRRGGAAARFVAEGAEVVANLGGNGVAVLPMLTFCLFSSVCFVYVCVVYMFGEKCILTREKEKATNESSFPIGY